MSKDLKIRGFCWKDGHRFRVLAPRNTRSDSVLTACVAFGARTNEWMGMRLLIPMIGKSGYITNITFEIVE